MKKFVLLIVLIIFLTSCQAKPILAPTVTIAPTNTIEPTFTPIPLTPTPSITPLPPTPTEISINPDYLAGLKKSGFEKQFPLETVHDLGTNKDVKVTHCVIDFKGRNKVNFEYANLLILRVTKCYFIDANRKNQFVTVPLLIYNKDIDYYFNYYGFIDGKLKASEGYFDAQFEQLIKESPFKIYTILWFQFNNFGRDKNNKFWVIFFEKAVNLFGEPSEKFYNEGDTSEFQDYPGAENFIFPSKMWNDRGE